MGGSLMSDVDAAVLQYLTAIDSATQSIDLALWCLVGILLSAAFAYFALGWFR